MSWTHTHSFMLAASPERVFRARLPCAHRAGRAHDVDCRGGDASVPGQTITFHLEPSGAQGAKTKLTFVHAGFGRATDVSDYSFGWTYFLDPLKKEAERA